MQKDAHKTTSLCNSKMSRSNWRNRSSIPNLLGISCQRLNGKLWSKPLDRWAWLSCFCLPDIAGVFTDEEWWKVAWRYFTSGASAGYARRWFPESLASCSLRGKQFLLDSVCNTFYNVISFPDTCGGRRDDMPELWPCIPYLEWNPKHGMWQDSFDSILFSFSSSIQLLSEHEIG